MPDPSDQPPHALCTPPLLEAQGLSCRRGGRPLFDGLTLRVEAGQLWWLSGANGQGKSTLLRVLAGVGRPARGQVHRHQPCVYLGHQDALHPDLSALDALGFLVRLHHGPVSTVRLQQALREVGLATHGHQPVRRLSQGQRKRVSLCRLWLAPTAGVWLLDEPLDALDDEGVNGLTRWWQAHRERGGAVVMSSHQALPLLPQVRRLHLSPQGAHGAQHGQAA